MLPHSQLSSGLFLSLCSGNNIWYRRLNLGWLCERQTPYPYPLYFRANSFVLGSLKIMVIIWFVVALALKLMFWHEVLLYHTHCHYVNVSTSTCIYLEKFQFKPLYPYLITLFSSFVIELFWISIPYHVFRWHTFSHILLFLLVLSMIYLAVHKHFGLLYTLLSIHTFVFNFCGCIPPKSKSTF